MNPIRINELESAAERDQTGGGSWTFFKTLLLASTLMSGGLLARPADAQNVVTTTGTITSGSETGGLFGLPMTTTSLDGDSYTLAITYDELSPNYYTSGNGTAASDFDVAGAVTATVNGHSVTTDVSSLLGSNLSEDLYGLIDSLNGYDAAGDFVTASQILSCTSACVPYANLQTPFSHTLGGSDYGADSYTFEAAGFPAVGTPTATFSGTETSMTYQVPEPESWALLATGLLGLGMLARRRRA